MDIKEAQSLVSHMLGHRALRESRWRELRKWICPTRGLFDDQDDFENPGDQILFTHAGSSAVLRGASGMTSGMTPRNVAWFKPDFSETRLLEASGARQWLDEAGRLMRDCLANGGFYQAIQSFNIDLLWAGCGLLYSEKAEDHPLHFECCQVGTFCVELDRHDNLRAVARRLKFGTQELLNEFGKDNAPDSIRAIANIAPYQPQYVWHLCRREDEGKWPVSSCYYVEGNAADFLRQSGYEEMPYFFTCWHKSAAPYGIGPGDECLPDAMQLDELERRKLEGIAKITDPPMQAPSLMKDMIDLSPGGLNFVPDKTLVQSILDLSPFAHSLMQLREEINTVRQRMEQTLYASIFTSMPLEQRPRDMSATEFLERKREALQQLGPVISAYEPNVLTPLLYRVLMALRRRGLMPPLPPALANADVYLKMDFISPMANALRQTGAETTRALFQDVAAIAQAAQNPEIFDKIDMDQMIDELATGLGCPGSVIRSDEDVAKIRQQRAQAQAQQRQMLMAQQQMQTEETAGRAANQQMQAARTLQEMAENGGA